MIWSSKVTAEEIDERLDIADGQVTARGSKVAGPPPLPRFHMWELKSDLPDTERIDQHLKQLFGKLHPSERVLKDLLATNHDMVAQLQVVRYFDEGPDDYADAPVPGVEEPPPNWALVPGQHRLLGMVLSAEWIAFLHNVGANLQFDEYD